MKIKSRFKDYYDYVAHAYGGGDERVLYLREPLKDDQLSLILDGKNDIVGPGLSETKTSTKFLVINGQVYTLIAVRDDTGSLGPYKLFTQENFGDCVDNLRARYRYWTPTRKPDSPAWWAHHFACHSTMAVEISKAIRQPVFLINQAGHDWSIKKNRFVLDKNIPILADYGIAHHIQPEQLYQEIAYYISNKMVNSPDLEVHDNMTDKEKILQHGFDIRQSFRHRK